MTAYFNTGQRYLTADHATSGSFYLFNSVGVFATSNGGSTWTKQCSAATCVGGTTGFGLGNTPQLKATTGEAADLWLAGSAGGNPGSQPFTSSGLYHSTNGGTSFTQITNVEEPYCVGFGANSGGGYPSVYIVGWVNVSGTFTYGAWESDNASSGATPTWKSIGLPSRIVWTGN